MLLALNATVEGQSTAHYLMDQLAGVNTLIVYGDTTREARAVAEDLRRRVSRPDLRVVVRRDRPLPLVPRTRRSRGRPATVIRPRA